uniref:Uncharacterized protein n=1 Tax=Serinus canaria TaxID=9135 RepID=A0A8C9U8P7_SERCA
MCKGQTCCESSGGACVDLETVIDARDVLIDARSPPRGAFCRGGLFINGTAEPWDFSRFARAEAGGSRRRRGGARRAQAGSSEAAAGPWGCGDCILIALVFFILKFAWFLIKCNIS